MRPAARARLKALADRLPEDDVRLLVRLARGIFVRGRWGRRLVRDVEDRTDVTALDVALADPSPSIPWEEVKAKLGLTNADLDAARPRRRARARS
jgi:hypothetical protein